MGFFIREKMVKPFADAAFALKKAKSAKSCSKYGFHIIQLQDIKPANTPAFETVKARVTQDYQQEQSNLHFANDTRALAEEVSKNPLSLKAAAEKLGLTLQTANGISRQPAANAQDVLSHPKLLKALFAAQSLDKKHATEVLTLAPNLIAVGRVVAHARACQNVRRSQKPASARLCKPKLQNSHSRRRSAAQTMGSQPAASANARTRAGVQSATSRSAASRSGAQPCTLSAANCPAFEGVNIAGQGYAIVRVNKVLEPDAAAAAIQCSKCQPCNRL